MIDLGFVFRSREELNKNQHSHIETDDLDVSSNVTSRHPWLFLYSTKASSLVLERDRAIQQADVLLPQKSSNKIKRTKNQLVNRVK